MRKLLRFVVLLFLLAAVAAALLVIFIDRAAKTAIEEGGTYALGVPTHLEKADIGLTSGRFALTGLAIDNPQGFDAPRFLSIGRGELALTLGSLTEDTIEAPTLELSGIELALERKDGKANYDTILASLERFSSKDDGKSAPQPKGDEPQSTKRFVIREVIVRDVKATIQLLPIGGELTKTTVTVPSIRLTNVGEDGRSMSQLFAEVLDGILRAVIDVGGKDLPKELLKDLKQKLPDVEALKRSLENEVKGALDDLQEKSKELGGELGKEAEKALDGAKKELEGLFEKK
ncbi:MAG: AsmA family protein [Planctomycetes bacterium]|nr:AsmA family protein [Planctomycetota bacterium]